MNQLTTHNTPEPHYLSEQRKNERLEVIHLLAITERGTGQILDITREGCSFGCLYPHTFPREFYLDILDAKGSHIKKIKVRKIRETSGDYQEELNRYAEKSHPMPKQSIQLIPQIIFPFTLSHSLHLCA